MKKYLDILILSLTIFFVGMGIASAQIPLTTSITTINETVVVPSVTITVADVSISSTNIILVGHIKGGTGPYKCSWDLGQGYTPPTNCELPSAQQKIQDKKKFLQSDDALSTMGNRYSKVGTFVAKFRATDIFGTISESQPLTIKVVDKKDAANITVLAPNGGEVLTIGETFQIRWDKGGINTSQVQVAILDAENRRLGKNIFKGMIENDGSENWTVSAFEGDNLYDYKLKKTVPTSGKYILSVICTNGFPCNDESDGTFTIEPKKSIPIIKMPETEKADLNTKEVKFSDKELSTIGGEKEKKSVFRRFVSWFWSIFQ